MASINAKNSEFVAPQELIGAKTHEDSEKIGHSLAHDVIVNPQNLQSSKTNSVSQNPLHPDPTNPIPVTEHQVSLNPQKDQLKVSLAKVKEVVVNFFKGLGEKILNVATLPKNNQPDQILDRGRINRSRISVNVEEPSEANPVSESRVSTEQHESPRASRVSTEAHSEANPVSKSRVSTEQHESLRRDLGFLDRRKNLLEADIAKLKVIQNQYDAKSIKLATAADLLDKTNQERYGILTEIYEVEVAIRKEKASIKNLSKGSQSRTEGEELRKGEARIEALYARFNELAPKDRESKKAYDEAYTAHAAIKDEMASLKQSMDQLSPKVIHLKIIQDKIDKINEELTS